MKRTIAPLVLLAILALLPLVLQDPYYLHLVIMVLMWVAIGTGWNIISGYAGQVLFGAAAFYGVGAYTAALLVNNWEISAWWGLPLGAMLCVLLAVPFGWICFRLRGPYFALATLALNEIFRYIAMTWESFTQGMVGIIIMQSFVSKVPYYYVALAVAAGSVITVALVTRSKWGYFFVSIREDQDASESLGINTQYYKMLALCLAAFFIGLTGALYTVYSGFIDPKIVFSLHDVSIMAILVGIVGGVATVYGPVVGAFIMVALQELFRSGGFGVLAAISAQTGSPIMVTITKYVSEAHVFSFGILVVVVIRFLPNGVVGDWAVLKRALLFWKKQAA
jgi:branched-chain amino acid transport system permease protein